MNSQPEQLEPAGRGASARAIQAHYDVSNEFFALWLDSTMSYSCALWQPDDTLEPAQVRKLDFHLQSAQARGKRRLLDIGCGWGSLLRRGLADYGVERAVGLTLSAEQLAWTQRGPRDPRLEIRLESWADHVPAEPYDAIVSVGAFEHFAKAGLSKPEKQKAYRSFFEWCHQHSSPGCRISLQTIVYENYDEAQPNKFVEDIFPESDLPRLAEVCAASQGLFEVVSVRNDREHYAQTLRCWYASLRANKARAIELVGPEQYARYEKYLAVFVVGFHIGTVNLARLALRKIEPSV